MNQSSPAIKNQAIPFSGAKITKVTSTYNSTAQYLISVVQQISLARDLDSIIAIVRHAARELTGADGATFVLREGEYCFYVDEEGIGPLWKGCRFPLTACISGWTMLNRQAVAIEDIYMDARIPVDAYRPTFVRSLAMVPIRKPAPIGAIGNYWAQPHQATEEEMALLQALADSTSIAMENVQLYAEMEQRIKERSAELAAANKELEAFSYSVSHDLRAPLRAIKGFTQLVLERSGHHLDEDSRTLMGRVLRATDKMSELSEALLNLARFARAEMVRRQVNLSHIVNDTVTELRRATPERNVEVEIEPDIQVDGDPGLLQVALDNLLNNAWKYTSKKDHAHIRFGCKSDSSVADSPVYYVQDNGAGFDMAYSHNLFCTFHRLHNQTEFPGTGVGLATVQRIIQRHGGKIWAEAAVERGATFYFTLR